VVIGGPLGALEALRPRLLDAGATRVIRLQVSAAFHTRWMEPAARRLGRALESAVFADAALAVYGNVDARPESGAEALRRRLGRQLTSRVRWTECIRAMAGDGVDEFVEIGPRRTLAPLVREITPDASVQHRYSPDGPVAAAGAVAPPGGRA
jgi:malonyl CoA-acyl carrier protein transacylase